MRRVVLALLVLLALPTYAQAQSVPTAQAKAPLSASQILASTLDSYAKATTLKDALSIEQWCHDSLAATEFDRDQFVLMRGISLNDNTKTTAILIVAARLKALEDQEAELLCAPGALQ